MFHDISADMQRVMHAMEEQLERDQPSLRSVSTGCRRAAFRFWQLSAPPGAFLELGSSGGYSSLWLSLAARARGVTLTTVDLDEKKVALARQNIAQRRRGGFGPSLSWRRFRLCDPFRESRVLLLRYRAAGNQRQDLRAGGAAPRARRMARRRQRNFAALSRRTS